MLQGQPQSAHESAPRDPANKAGATCPECLQSFPRKHPGQLFCSATHRDAWNNRATVRGRVLTPLAIVERVTRGGSRGDAQTGKRARQQKDALIQRWIEEDRAAGRMAWTEYMARRYAVGFDPLA
jgi:hypothetical protein